MQRSVYRLATFLTLVAISGAILSAKDKRPKAKLAQRQDQIEVAAHLPNADGPIIRFVATRHYDRSYIYAERETGKPLTLIDVTNPAHPLVLSQSDFPGLSGNHLLAVAGTAALTSDAEGEKIPVPQIIRIMDFSDPAKPKVAKKFDNVTAIQKVSGGLIMLANGDGIWILSQQFAEDPVEDERYAKKVIYGESMY